jgi:flagellar assembly protein FliH
MAAAKKFLFDVSFDQVEGGDAPRRAIERKFNRAELEATRAAALAEGHAAGRAEAEDAALVQTAAALDAIGARLAALISDQDAASAATERRAIAALRAIVAKTVPALAATDPLAEIEALVTKSLHEAIDEPRVVLRVADALYEPVQARLAAILAASGYAGRIVLMADDEIAGGDARVEWADGGAERDLDRQLGEIDAALARHADPATPPLHAFPKGDDA